MPSARCASAYLSWSANEEADLGRQLRDKGGRVGGKGEVRVTGTAWLALPVPASLPGFVPFHRDGSRRVLPCRGQVHRATARLISPTCLPILWRSPTPPLASTTSALFVSKGLKDHQKTTLWCLLAWGKGTKRVCDVDDNGTISPSSLRTRRLLFPTLASTGQLNAPFLSYPVLSKRTHYLNCDVRTESDHACM